MGLTEPLNPVMDNNQLPGDAPREESVPACANCGSAQVVPGYPTALCHDCRQAFMQYRFPLGIKIFAGAVAALVLFALFTFPKNLKLGVHYEKAKKARQTRHYKVAQQEYTIVSQQIKDNEEAEAYLMLSAFHNEDFETFYKQAEKLKGKQINNDLVIQLNNALDRAAEYFPEDSLSMLMEQYKDTEGGIPDTVFNRYLCCDIDKKIVGLCSYASSQFDKERFVACDSLLHRILEMDPEYTPALRMLASSKRQQGAWKESLKACDELLGINRDDAYAVSSKSRTYLKQGNYKDGLTFALKSMEMDKTFPYGMATLALAYHLNKQTAKRDELIRTAKASKDSTVMSYMQYTIDVMEQKEKF